jgi:hypothetical protein
VIPDAPDDMTERDVVRLYSDGDLLHLYVSPDADPKTLLRLSRILAHQSKAISLAVGDDIVLEIEEARNGG